MGAPSVTRRALCIRQHGSCIPEVVGPSFARRSRKMKARTSPSGGAHSGSVRLKQTQGLGSTTEPRNWLDQKVWRLRPPTNGAQHYLKVDKVLRTPNHSKSIAFGFRGQRPWL